MFHFRVFAHAFQYFLLALYDKSAYMKVGGQLRVGKKISQSSDTVNE